MGWILSGVGGLGFKKLKRGTWPRTCGGSFRKVRIGRWACKRGHGDRRYFMRKACSELPDDVELLRDTGICWPR